MPIRESIFGSPRERHVFEKLRAQWGADYHLYPGLKFAHIVDLHDLTLSPDETKFLLATEVDYTLCNQDDQPLVSIEFDGMTKGVSRDGAFVSGRPDTDPSRARKFDLKLRVAELVGYPFAVVSNQEAAPLSDDDTLMVLDGIVGQVLAMKEARQEITRLGDVLPGEVEGMSQEERDEYIQDRVLDIEIEAEFRHDPLTRLAAELQHRLMETGCSTGGSGHRYLDDDTVPPFPEPPFQFTPESYTAFLQERSRALGTAKRHGSESTIVTTVGTFKATAWIRNFGIGSGCLTVVENISKIRALRQALRAVANSASRE
jgi:hypothetical protein